MYLNEPIKILMVGSAYRPDCGGWSSRSPGPVSGQLGKQQQQQPTGENPRRWQQHVGLHQTEFVANGNVHRVHVDRLHGHDDRPKRLLLHIGQSSRAFHSRSVVLLPPEEIRTSAGRRTRFSSYPVDRWRTIPTVPSPKVKFICFKFGAIFQIFNWYK